MNRRDSGSEFRTEIKVGVDRYVSTYLEIYKYRYVTGRLVAWVGPSSDPTLSEVWTISTYLLTLERGHGMDHGRQEGREKII